jgi:hypothetical protein
MESRTLGMVRGQHSYGGAQGKTLSKFQLSSVRLDFEVSRMFQTAKNAIAHATAM